MYNFKKKILIPVIFFLFFVPAGVSCAFEGDGFSAAEKLESKYFTIYLASKTDISGLNRELDMASSDMLIAGENAGWGQGGAGTMLARMVDTLFLRACGILDMNLYSFHGSIKVCRDTAQTEEIYQNLFSRDLGSRVSFYVFDLNTIYIAAGSFRKEILGHEIAHALICHYFAVSPTIKIQEVLAAYVEYQLRR